MHPHTEKKQMRKLFIDTNIVIDLLSRRAPYYEASAMLFSLADKKQIELTISSLSIANTSYVLLRQMDAGKAKSILRKLRLIVTILSLDDKIVGLALNDEHFSDFEDALQYFTALENRQDLIITRNLKDFKHSKLPVMTAQQFIETIE
jgi:predicted nucleic acid-binding protein